MTKDLASASTFVEAFHQAFAELKARNPRLSLASVGKRCGIQSRGYLSEMLSGKRRLHRKYVGPLAAIFRLSDFEAEFLQKLLDLEYQKNPVDRRRLQRQLKVLRKIIRINFTSLHQEPALTFFCFKVFAALGLFNPKPTASQLQDFFGPPLRKSVALALTKLLAMGLVEEKPDGIYESRQGVVLFSKSTTGVSHLDFLRLSLQDAADQVETYFDRPHEARFHSTLLSVKQAEFEKYLPKIRKQIIKDQVKLEASDGDTLIHYNVQIYPVRIVGKG